MSSARGRCRLFVGGLTVNTMQQLFAVLEDYAAIIVACIATALSSRYEKQASKRSFMQYKCAFVPVFALQRLSRKDLSTAC